MRRLPIFFVLDCSESMIGENLKKMNDGLQMIINDLKKDPHALETAWISVIAFDGVAKNDCSSGRGCLILSTSTTHWGRNQPGGGSAGVNPPD